MKKIGLKIYLVSLFGIIFLSFINIALISYFQSISDAVARQIDADNSAHEIQKLNSFIANSAREIKFEAGSYLDLAEADFSYLIGSFESQLLLLEIVPEVRSIKAEVEFSFNALKEHAGKIFILERSLRIKKNNIDSERSALNELINQSINLNGNTSAKILRSEYRLSETNYFDDFGNKDLENKWVSSSEELAAFLNKQNGGQKEADDFAASAARLKVLAEEYGDLIMHRDYHLSLLEESFININFEANEIINISNNKYQAILKANSGRFSQSVVAVIISFIATLVMLYIIVKNIVTPIEVLTRSAADVLKGNIKNRVEIKSKDEIGYLASVFNEMLSDIETFQKTVKENQNNLKIMNSDLEAKIAERTKELEQIKDNLEIMVKERTSELQAKIKELEKFRDLTVGREVRMINLKKELEDLKKKDKL